MSKRSSLDAGVREHVKRAPVLESTEDAAILEGTQATSQRANSLQYAIEKLQSHKESDELGSKIFAAAVTLRDSTGRDRLAILRQMAATWKVD